MNNEATQDEDTGEQKESTMRVRQVNGCKADEVAMNRLENFSYDLRFGGEEVRLFL